MRKKRFLSVIFVFLMASRLVGMPVWAEDADNPDQNETVQTESQSNEESVQATQPADTSVPTLPEGFSGDASVSMGSHSINALYPVINSAQHPIDAKASIAYEVGTDTLVYASNVDARLYPASMTKIMTCLVALEHCNDLSEIVTVNGEAISYLDEAGSGASLLDGEQMSMENLLYCLMVKSANDAAVTIATHLAGSEDAFVEWMNQKAAEIGCSDTHFANAHGLHDEDHYTTARDMAKIMTTCIQNEMFRQLYSETYYKVPATNLSEERTLYTTNYLMSEDLDQNYYDSRVIGGKTGFTTPAGRCLVTVSESNGMQMVIVIMGAEASYAEDGYSLLSYGNFEATVELMDLSFTGFMPTQVLSANQVLEQFPVSNGVTDAQGYVQNSVGTIVPSGSNMTSIRYEYDLDNGGVSAPVKVGDAIGIVRVWTQNRCVAQQELYSSVDVAVKPADYDASKPVNPAAELNETTSAANTILMVLIGILVVLVLIIVVIRVRNSMIRARRKRQRAMRRRRRS